MNRELIVSLLKKNIDELILITEGFMEMTEYPSAIINLAKNKTDDIRAYIDMLGDVKIEKIPVMPQETKENISTEVVLPEVTVYPEVDDEERAEKEEEEEENIREKTEAEKTRTEQVDTEEVVDTEQETIPHMEQEQIPEQIPEEKSDPEVIPHEEAHAEPEKKITLGEKIGQQGISRNDLHARNDQNDLNASIANKKITDIRQAISLGDRFRFQRELFRNNGEEMNKMLSYINMLATYEEIVAFLQSKYNWPEDNPAAIDFYQIVKRKF